MLLARVPVAFENLPARLGEDDGRTAVADRNGSAHARPVRLSVVGLALSGREQSRVGGQASDPLRPRRANPHNWGQRETAAPRFS